MKNLVQDQTISVMGYFGKSKIVNLEEYSKIWADHFSELSGLIDFGDDSSYPKYQAIRKQVAEMINNKFNAIYEEQQND